jgi:Lhr-like helicase
LNPDPAPARARRWPHSSSAFDRLVRQASAGALVDESQVLYVSPLKALSNDICRRGKALTGPRTGLRLIATSSVTAEFQDFNRASDFPEGADRWEVDLFRA